MELIVPLGGGNQSPNTPEEESQHNTEEDKQENNKLKHSKSSNDEQISYVSLIFM